MARRYVPDAGDIVWLNFTPQAGHEQAGASPRARAEPGCIQQQNQLDDLLSSDDTDQELSV